MVEQSVFLGQSQFQQALFFGRNSIDLLEFRYLYPTANNSKNVEIEVGFPYFFGVMKHPNTIHNVSKDRIFDRYPATIKGKRTLVILADINSIDGNASFLDNLVFDLQTTIKNMEMKMKYVESENQMILTFIKENHIETDLENWLFNKMELLKQSQLKMGPRFEEPSGLSIQLAKPEGEEKRK